MPSSSARGFTGVLLAGEPPRLGAVPDGAPAGDLRVWLRGHVENRAAIVGEVAARTAGRTVAEAYALDVAAIASAYGRWGARLGCRVDGEYAIAVYDAADRSLLLAHDELGLVPLFYAYDARRVAFATNLAALVEEMGVGELDEEHIADQFARAEHFGRRTPYAAISRLLPGESVVWRDGALVRHDVWTLAHVAPTGRADVREERERLRALLEAAVIAATPAGETTLCELSGGLDSSTIYNLARLVPGARVETLSYRYSRSTSSDEGRWIDVVLGAAPAPWHPIDVDATPAFSAFPRARVGEPNAWIWNAALDRAYVDAVAATGAGVVLTGEGGDAVLSGDHQLPYFLADRLRSGDLARLAREARAWRADTHGKRSLRHTVGRYALGGLASTLRGRALEWRPFDVPWIDAAYARRIGARTRGRAPWLPPADGVGNAYMLQRVMRAAAVVALHYHGRGTPVPFRSPMLSRPLLAFMLAVPWERRIAPGDDRLLQRAAFRGIVPAETLARRGKGGSSQPFFDGLDAGRAWRMLLTEKPRIVDRGYARLEPWRAAIEMARVGRIAEYMPLRGAVALEWWFQQLESLPSQGDRRLAAAARPVV